MRISSFSRIVDRAILSMVACSVALSAGIISAAQAGCVNCPPRNSEGAYDPSPEPFDAVPPAESNSARRDATPFRTGTNSTTLQTGTDSTLLQTGTGSTTLQVGTDSTTLQTGTGSTMIQAGVERMTQPLNILIMLDASQSMKEGINGMFSGSENQKMDAAKRVLQETMAIMPPDINVGLRVFGHQFNNTGNDCFETALLVPIGKGNRRSIIERVRQIRPAGMTPLTFALTNAERDLQFKDGIKQIVLISDGAETCGGDPCMYIHRLTQKGIKVKIDIVGLGLKHDEAAKSQLDCIAQASGGKFYDANTMAELQKSVREIVNKAVGEAKVSGKVIMPVKPTQPAEPKEPVKMDPTMLPPDLR